MHQIWAYKTTTNVKNSNNVEKYSFVIISIGFIKTSSILSFKKLTLKMVLYSPIFALCVMKIVSTCAKLF